MNAVELPALTLLLRALKLAAMAERHEEIIRQAESEGWTQGKCLRALVDLELAHRRTKRIERLLKASGLPAEKTLATLNQDKLPSKVRRQLPALCDAGFIDRAENVLIFGLPGRGKTHVACAIGHVLAIMRIRVNLERRGPVIALTKIRVNPERRPPVIAVAAGVGPATSWRAWPWSPQPRAA